MTTYIIESPNGETHKLEVFRTATGFSVYVDGSNIILKKYEPNCIFCGNSKKLSEYKGKLVCDKFFARA